MGIYEVVYVVFSNLEAQVVFGIINTFQNNKWTIDDNKLFYHNLACGVTDEFVEDLKQVLGECPPGTNGQVLMECSTTYGPHTNTVKVFEIKDNEII